MVGRQAHRLVRLGDRVGRAALLQEGEGQEGVRGAVLRVLREQAAQFPLRVGRAAQLQQRARPLDRVGDGYHLPLPPLIQGISSSQAPESLACIT